MFGVTSQRFSCNRVLADNLLLITDDYYRITLSARASTFGGIGCFKVDDELKLLRLLDGEISRLCAFENFVHVGSGTPVLIDAIWPIGHQAARLHSFGQSKNRG